MTVETITAVLLIAVPIALVSAYIAWSLWLIVIGVLLLV